ncbi:hypothetical protein FRC17_001077 [Serendipita sp. 399]|nr:hypothetical protein FRC17_001077 [Serendipita sp. 399]
MFTLHVETTQDDHQVVVDISASEDDPVIVGDIAFSDVNGPLVDYTADATYPGVLIDDNDELVTYSDVGWQRKRDPYFVGETSSMASTPGAWVQLAFTGSGIWVYGAIPVEGTVFSLEVIKKYGREVTRSITIHNVTRPGLDIPLYQAPLLKERDLPYANAYVYKLTLISGSLLIDFFGVDGYADPAKAGDIQASDQGVVMWPHALANVKVVILSVVICGVAFTLLVGVALFILYRRYRIGWRSLDFSIELTQRKPEDVIQSFPVISTELSRTYGDRKTKGRLPHVYSAILHHSPSSSSHQTSRSRDDSTATYSILSASSQSGSRDLESQEPSEMSLGIYGTEEAGEPLSLSHADLARVFRRAEQLRFGSDGRSEGLESQLEALSRQLANRR